MQVHNIHIECIDGKCNYSSKKRLRELARPRNPEDEREIYGSKTGFERFQDLGIPVLLLQNDISEQENSMCDIDYTGDVQPISTDLFDNLFNAVQDSPVQKTQSKNTRKIDRNKLKNTRRKNNK